MPEVLGHWGDIRARFEKAYQGTPDAECGHLARLVRIAKTQHGTAAKLDLPQLTTAPVTRALLAQVRHPGCPLGAQLLCGCWPKLDTRGFDERAPARVLRPRVKPFLDRVFGLASRNHCC